jgi:hypothetical protein
LNGFYLQNYRRHHAAALAINTAMAPSSALFSQLQPTRSSFRIDLPASCLSPFLIHRFSLVISVRLFFH